MENLQSLMAGFELALSWHNVLFMVVGVLLGIVVGVLPGLGGPNGVAILLPLTFGMDPTSAIILLSSIYWGALFGGAITRSSSTFRARPGRSPPPSTDTRSPSRAGPARR